VNLSIGEATAEIQKAADKLLKDATVQVKLLSFKFTVLGEVARPGTYRNFNNQLTVLEAIGTAGDITSFGNRERILVLRPGTAGTQTYRINLKTKELLSSEAFFLLPNDIVYVESIDSKIFQLNIPTVSLLITTLFSTISTTLLILNFSK
jgi:polysaccharide export outer membrane protein